MQTLIDYVNSIIGTPSAVGYDYIIAGVLLLVVVSFIFKIILALIRR